MRLRLLLLLPVLAPLVVFALTNQQRVHLAFWPTAATLDAPLSLTVLVALGAGMLLGATLAWLAGLSLRARASRAEQARALLEGELRRLKANPPAPPLPPPG